MAARIRARKDWLQAVTFIGSIEFEVSWFAAAGTALDEDIGRRREQG